MFPLFVNLYFLTKFVYVLWEDIAAFKLDAIIKRKEKKIFGILRRFWVSFHSKAILRFYKEKYCYNDIKIVLDALSEVDIADDRPEPIVVKIKTWDEVKNNIKTAWKDFQFEGLTARNRKSL